MTVTTWIIPRTDIPSGTTPTSPGFSFVPGGRALALLGVTPSSITGGLDRLIDPTTRDYVRDGAGGWVETADSRTIMLGALSIELGASPFDPDHGTAIAQRFRDGTLTEMEFVQAETVRVGEDLAREGILSDLVVTIRDELGRPLVDESGRNVVHTSWRDLASGSPIDQTFTPG